MDGRPFGMSRILVSVKSRNTRQQRSGTVGMWISVGHAPIGGACQDLGDPVAAWRSPGSAPAAADALPGMLLLSLQPCGTRSLAPQNGHGGQCSGGHTHLAALVSGRHWRHEGCAADQALYLDILEPGLSGGRAGPRDPPGRPPLLRRRGGGHHRDRLGLLHKVPQGHGDATAGGNCAQAVIGAAWHLHGWPWHTRLRCRRTPAYIQARAAIVSMFYYPQSGRWNRAI